MTVAAERAALRERALVVVREHPGLTVHELAERLGRRSERKALRYQLLALLKQGRVRTEATGPRQGGVGSVSRMVRWYPSTA